MMFSSITSSLFFAAAAQATDFLYVSSYDGKVTTLGLKGSLAPGASIPTLKAISSTDGCAGFPSWLTLNNAESTLFCVDEGWTTKNGSLTSFVTSADGSLRQLNKVMTPGGPVSGVLYGQGRSGLAVAHYSSGAVTTWDVSRPSQLSLVQAQYFRLTQPGPIPDRQEASHPHQTSLDPTGKFIVVPDLGADKIYVYAITRPTNLKLKALAPISVKPGSGPRHITFAARNGKTFMYLVTELANTIIGFEVAYPSGSIAFNEIFTIGTHGAGKSVPKQAAAAEIVVSPDARYLIVSSRNESALSIPNFDPKNSTRIVSDPLINFSIDSKTGCLTQIQEVPCGGRFPRQFSINKAGNLVAVGQQSDGRVVLIKRDPSSGKLGKFAGYANVPGQISAVVFNEGS